MAGLCPEKWPAVGPGSGQLVPKTTRTQDNSYPRPDHSYPEQLAPKTTRTQDNPYPRQLVPTTTRTQVNSYPGQHVPKTTRWPLFNFVVCHTSTFNGLGRKGKRRWCASAKTHRKLTYLDGINGVKYHVNSAEYQPNISLFMFDSPGTHRDIILEYT